MAITDIPQPELEPGQEFIYSTGLAPADCVFRTLSARYPNRRDIVCLPSRIVDVDKELSGIPPAPVPPEEFETTS